MSNVSVPNQASKAVAKDFISVVTRVMKHSSAPMVAFAEQYDLSFSQLKLMFALSNLDEAQPIGRLAELTELGASSMSAIYESRVNTLSEILDQLSSDQVDALASALEPLKPETEVSG